MSARTRDIVRHVFSHVPSDDSLTVCLSGIQSRGKDQFYPIAHHLPGEVWAYHTEGHRYNPIRFVERVASDMAAAGNRKIQLVGASMGGVQLPFVMTRFRQLRPDFDIDNLMSVIVDSPSGAESMGMPLARLLELGAVKKALDYMPPWIDMPVFDVTLPLGGITLPAELVSLGCEETAEQYRKDIREAARRRLSGFSLRLILKQALWMVEVGKNGTLSQACETGLDDIQTFYLQCTLGNVTVLPSAAERWKRWVDLTLLKVAAGHCAFHQNQPVFERILPRIFAT